LSYREDEQMSKQPVWMATALCGALLLSGVTFADTRSDQPVADTVITTKVKAELAKDSATKARDIKVTTKDGVVTLSGTVGSVAEKQKAEQDAATIKGVTGVTNVLEVKEKMK
jgi:hyperosmotically inducible protein